MTFALSLMTLRAHAEWPHNLTASRVAEKRISEESFQNNSQMNSYDVRLLELAGAPLTELQRALCISS
jgi:hypothetical protein